jgi:hypothetical protein
MFSVESMPEQALDLLSMVGEVKTGKKHRNQVLVQEKRFTRCMHQSFIRHPH